MKIVDFYTIIAEVMKACAWPAVAVFALWYLRDGIVSVLRELLKLKLTWKKPDGTIIEAEIEEQKRASDPANAPVSTPENAPPVQSEASQLVRAHVIAQIEALDAGAQRNVLLETLVSDRLRLGHEYVYNRIFGSQIFGLRRLSNVAFATIDDARSFFAPYAAQYPEVYEKYPFENWLGFLVQMNMVTVSGNAVRITPLGRDFLLYLSVQRLSDGKPF